MRALNRGLPHVGANELVAVDESLGRILATLEALGKLDDTVVVLASDNGYFYGEHGLSEERRLAYEESIRLPLLVRYPPLVRAGVTAGELALVIDLAPTLLEVAGLPPMPATQGRSLVPVFKGTSRDWRTSFLVEYFTDRVFPRVRNMGYVAVRTTRYKYIHYLELKDMDELYDLEADPYELRNLAGVADARPVLAAMQQELARLMAESKYPAPHPRP